MELMKLFDWSVIAERNREDVFVMPSTLR